ncbi:thioredoxin-interacting protein-like [Babylonia areolata]|uniref:thioredoxin-interacting protein-like n=1 Tax=Babylonia areolata TaxID=304850 RepID=UPI003FD35B0E
MVLRRPHLPAKAFADAEMSNSKTFFGFLIAGNIKVQCRISRSAAIPGEIIYVNAEVTNRSPRGITLLQASVILQSTYRAQNSKHKKIITRQTLNKRIDVFDVPDRRGRRWRNVQMAVPPFLPDSSLEGCTIIDVDYFFEFRAQVEDRNDVVVEFPLYVGAPPPDSHDDTASRKGSQGPRHVELDPFSSSSFHNELPWYGRETMTEMESVDGDLFEVR